jgi:hypothetical protein
MLRSGIASEFFGMEDKKPLGRDEALAMLRSGECRVMLRVESCKDEPGRRAGAYANGAADRCIYMPLGADDDELSGTHPGPHNDAGLQQAWFSLKDRSSYYFGFSKFNQYKNWFFLDDPLKAEAGRSVLGVYVVSKKHSHIGQFQMIADRRDMIHLIDLPMTYKLDETLQELFDAQEAVCQ